MSKIEEVNVYTGIVKTTYEKSKQIIPQMENREQFIKFYVKNISSLQGLRGNDHIILYSLLELTTYDNLIAITQVFRDNILNNLNIAKSTFNNTIGRLLKKNILIRKGQSTFLLNPFLFGRGRVDTIKNLRLTLNYDFDKRTFSLGNETDYYNPQEQENNTIIKLENQLKKAKEKMALAKREIELEKKPITILR